MHFQLGMGSFMHHGLPIAGGFLGTVSVNSALAGCAASAPLGSHPESSQVS